MSQKFAFLGSPGLQKSQQAPGIPYASPAGPPGMAAASTPVHQSGGDILSAKRDPSFQPVHRRFSRSPLAAMYDPALNSSRPIVYELGSFRVPEGKRLWCMDYKFGVQVFSGVQAAAAVPSVEGEFSSQLAFDISIDATRRQADLVVDITPKPTTLQRSQYIQPSGPRSADTILRSAQDQAVNVTGFGSSALPDVSSTYSPRGIPLTILCEPGDNLVLLYSVIAPLGIPIYAIVGEFSGFTVDHQVADALEKRLKPT